MRGKLNNRRTLYTTNTHVGQAWRDTENGGGAASRYIRRQKIERCPVSTYLRHPEFNCKLNLDNFSLFGIWNSLLVLASISLGKLVLSGHIPSTIGTFLRKTLSNFSSKFFRKTGSCFRRARLSPSALRMSAFLRGWSWLVDSSPRGYVLTNQLRPLRKALRRPNPPTKTTTASWL